MKTLFLAVVAAPVSFLFYFHTIYTQVTLLFILINVQYLQNVVFSFEKGLSGQNHSLSDSHHLIEKSPLANFPSPSPLTLFGKPCTKDQVCKGLFAYSKLNSTFLLNLFQVKFNFFRVVS